MQAHLGCDKYARNEQENSRNGINTKKVISDEGEVEISVPRERDATFEPLLVAKRQRRLEGFDDKVRADPGLIFFLYYPIVILVILKFHYRFVSFLPTTV